MGFQIKSNYSFKLKPFKFLILFWSEGEFVKYFRVSESHYFSPEKLSLKHFSW